MQDCGDPNCKDCHPVIKVGNNPLNIVAKEVTCTVVKDASGKVIGMMKEPIVYTDGTVVACIQLDEKGEFHLGEQTKLHDFNFSAMMADSKEKTRPLVSRSQMLRIRDRTPVAVLSKDERYKPCELCGKMTRVRGSVVACGTCRDEQAADYYGDLRQSRGY